MLALVAPDYETKSSYSVVVTASDEQENEFTEQSVTILITNINDNCLNLYLLQLLMWRKIKDPLVWCKLRTQMI